ncbi:hypothetical protein DFH09DRAFT_1074866 [Mycena vulgaris]|nr:hypothetical protein DFH09DRAFT_1074866 [Mycena vulgaris]
MASTLCWSRCAAGPPRPSTGTVREGWGAQGAGSEQYLQHLSKPAFALPLLRENRLPKAEDTGSESRERWEWLGPRRRATLLVPRTGKETWAGSVYGENYSLDRRASEFHFPIMNEDGESHMHAQQRQTGGTASDATTLVHGGLGDYYFQFKHKAHRRTSMHRRGIEPRLTAVSSSTHLTWSVCAPCTTGAPRLSSKFRQAWAWIWVYIKAQARQIGLQAHLSAWQARLLA